MTLGTRTSLGEFGHVIRNEAPGVLPGIKMKKLSRINAPM